MQRKLNLFLQGEITQEKFLELFQGWKAYTKWGNSYNLQNKFLTNLKNPLFLI